MSNVNHNLTKNNTNDYMQKYTMYTSHSNPYYTWNVESFTIQSTLLIGPQPFFGGVS